MNDIAQLMATMATGMSIMALGMSVMALVMALLVEVVALVAGGSWCPWRGPWPSRGSAWRSERSGDRRNREAERSFRNLDGGGGAYPIAPTMGYAAGGVGRKRSGGGALRRDAQHGALRRDTPGRCTAAGAAEGIHFGISEVERAVAWARRLGFSEAELGHRRPAPGETPHLNASPDTPNWVNYPVHEGDDGPGDAG